MAWRVGSPALAAAASAASESGRPAASQSCSRTMSSPLTSSVIPCSTWRRVFTSRNQTAPPGSRRNSAVAALVRAAADAIRTARSCSPRRAACDSPGAGASSTSFWWRRWMSNRARRSPRPRPSRPRGAGPRHAGLGGPPARGRPCRRRTPLAASADAVARAAGRSAARSTRRIPRPPPPAAAFTSSGKPIASASARMASTASGRSTGTASRVPGTVSTPALRASRRAPSLSPSASITAAVGPMNVRPASATARAKVARSARNPYPGWTAWAPVEVTASRIGVDPQIALGGRGRSDADRDVGEPDVHRVRVGVAVDGDRLDPEVPARADDPDGDLAPVGDQDPVERPAVFVQRRVVERPRVRAGCCHASFAD